MRVLNSQSLITNIKHSKTLIAITLIPLKDSKPTKNQILSHHESVVANFANRRVKKW